MVSFPLAKLANLLGSDTITVYHFKSYMLVFHITHQICRQIQPSKSIRSFRLVSLSWVIGWIIGEFRQKIT